MTHVHCTRPAGSGKSKVSNLPFAAVPHNLVADPRLTPLDKTLAALIIKFARGKSDAWPSNRRLAAELGRSPRTVQLALGRLQATGWLRIEPGRNPTGRRLVLAWRCANFCAPGAQGIAPLPAQSVAPEGDIVIVKRDAFKKSEIDLTERQRLEAPAATSARPEPPPAAPPSLPASAPCCNLPAESPPAAPTSIRDIITRRRQPQPLTSEQARRLVKLAPAVRERVMNLLATGDRVLVGEAHSLLGSDPVPASPPRRVLLEKPRAILPAASAPIRPSAPAQQPVQESAPEPKTEPIPQAQAEESSTTPIVSLTPEQARRFEELSPAMRERVMAHLATGDRILVGEAHKILTPRPEPKPEPRSTAELLAQIQDRPIHAVWAAEELARAFNDRKSWRGFRAVCERAWRGEFPPDVLVTAWREASGGKARNPGAVFNHVVKRESERHACPAGG
jgi:helix-turn-helix protein